MTFINEKVLPRLSNDLNAHPSSLKKRFVHFFYPLFCPHFSPFFSLFPSATLPPTLETYSHRRYSSVTTSEWENIRACFWGFAENSTTRTPLPPPPSPPESSSRLKWIIVNGIILGWRNFSNFRTSSEQELRKGISISTSLPYRIRDKFTLKKLWRWYWRVVVRGGWGGSGCRRGLFDLYRADKTQNCSWLG